MVLLKIKFVFVEIKVKSLELKKDTLKDKMKMQQNFIEELEDRGKQR